MKPELTFDTRIRGKLSFTFEHQTFTLDYEPKEPGEREGMEAMVRKVLDRYAEAAAPAGDAPPGFKLVPVEPTEEMLFSASHATNGVTAWRAMLDAAPAVPGDALIARDKLFVCPQAVNSVTRVTVEGEPAQAVPVGQPQPVAWHQLDDDGEPVKPEQLAAWLDMKFKRHGENEDKWAADYIRAALSGSQP